MPPDNDIKKPTRQELFNGAIASADELIAAQTEKLRLLKAHRQGLVQKFANEMKPTLSPQNKDAAKVVEALLHDDLQYLKR